MGTGDIIGLTYLGIAAACLIVGPMIGTWRAVAEWDGDWEEALLRIGLGITGGLAAGMVWPLAIPALIVAIPMLIVAGPAWHVRNKREQAETERRNTATALREAANLYRRGSEEWHMLRKVADETMAGNN